MVGATFRPLKVYLGAARIAVASKQGFDTSSLVERDDSIGSALVHVRDARCR